MTLNGSQKKKIFDRSKTAKKKKNCLQLLNFKIKKKFV